MNLISFLVADVDGDDVRCRWAESSLRECSGVCRAFTGATLVGVRTLLSVWGMISANLLTGYLPHAAYSYYQPKQ